MLDVAEAVPYTEPTPTAAHKTVVAECSSLLLLFSTSDTVSETLNTLFFQFQTP
ncbi:uncharacterized protein G2W53_043571 [Senna tora]|uniref:Uncharacterized protein n=1 Tax=Senna tora TaxID=362788 RepID=A0A834SH94_9FABA|nr:uncharacterized protein G2W53_043571 [Senna tora]